jgi:3-oxoacyl-[acyl-carrier-protein] synthase-3
MKAVIRAIECHLPEAVLQSKDLTREFPDWPVAKIESKTGISQRHIAAADECSSDLGIAAAKKLFASGAAAAADIDFLLFCTQSPDYFLPTTACLVQTALDIPTHAGALDFNLGCSGFVYGLSLAKGLIETGQAANVLLITAETYSKFIHPRDGSVRTIFGDAAAAILLRAETRDDEPLGPFVFGTDGRGAKDLIVPGGGMRAQAAGCEAVEDDQGYWRGPNNLYMNGAEVFNFAMNEVPASTNALLRRTNTTLADYDLFVFHQANRHMLNYLRKFIGIPEDRFYIGMERCGNTVSSTIPIALQNAAGEGRLSSGDRVMVVGFGVGYSWCAAALTWQ